MYRDIFKRFEVKNDPNRVNFVAVHGKRTYGVPATSLAAFFQDYEKLRRDGRFLSVAEKQTDLANGLFIDLDIKEGKTYDGVSAECVREGLLHRIPEITNRLCSIVGALQRRQGSPTEGGVGPVFWMTKSRALGIHVLIPESKLPKHARREALETLAPYLVRGVLDTASANVPCLLYGSKKTQDSEAYQLAYALSPPLYEVAIEDPEVLARYTAFDLRLVRHSHSEAAANGASSSGGAAATSTLLNEAVTMVNALYGIDLRVVNDVEDPLDSLHVSTTTAVPSETEVCRLLNKLPPAFYNDRDKWIQVVFCLANTDVHLKDAADQFSKKSPKYEAAAFENLWNSAVEYSSPTRITIKSLFKWVRDSYSITGAQEYDNMLKDLIDQSRGALPSGMCAQLIQQKLSPVLLFGRSPSAGEVWYTKVTDRNDPMFMKWELAGAIPQEIYKEIGTELPKHLLKAMSHYNESVSKNLYNTFIKCYTPQFKQQITTEAGYLMYNKHAIRRLDENGDVLGVQNGIVLLGPRCTLATSLDNEFGVTRYANVAYVDRGDPSLDRWTGVVKKMYENVFIEPDVAEFVQLMHSESLNGKEKYSPLLLLFGTGSNGKSVTQNAMLMLLNIDGGESGYAVKPTMKLFTGNRAMEKSGDHNSELYSVKHKRFSYCEETERAETMSSARLKELVNVGGYITTRPPYGRAQETFRNACTFTVASNYSITVTTTEHGTWRRLAAYRAKITFTESPDPANPLEKLADPLYLTTYPNHPLFKSALLSLLLERYETLQTTYGGYINRFKSPTLEAETKKYRIEQDTLYMWITSTLIHSDELDCAVPLSELARQYKQLHCPKATNKAVEDMLKNSILEKYISLTTTTSVPVVRNVKAVHFDYSPGPGERFIS